MSPLIIILISVALLFVLLFILGFIVKWIRDRPARLERRYIQYLINLPQGNPVSDEIDKINAKFGSDLAEKYKFIIITSHSLSDEELELRIKNTQSKLTKVNDENQRLKMAQEYTILLEEQKRRSNGRVSM